MFAPTIGDATICLRCQVRLARVKTPRRRALVNNQHLTISPQTRRSTTATEHVQASGDGDGPHQRILYPHGRLRGVPGRRVREGLASLGLEALGKPAEVIVLRDAELGLKHAPKTAVEDATEENLSATDLLASVDAERGLLPPEDVVHNIEEFKTLWPHKGLSWDQWLEARKELCKAFTAIQLTHYIVHKTQANAMANAQNQKTSNILQKSTWTPGETPFEGFRIGDIERKRILNTSPNLSRKEALADRVFGECWDLYVQAETDETGELELLLRPQDLSLLVGKNRGTLNNFAEKYNAKIDLSRRKNLLRFTADQVTCFRLTKDLEAVLGNIRHVDFDLSPLQPLLRKKPGGRRPLEKESVKWIAEITGTEIHESDDGQRLLIYYIGPSTNFADDARRLLLSLIGRANALPLMLRQYSISPVSAALCPMNPIEGLSWIDQRQQWSRWRCASSKLTVENSSVAKKANIGFEMNTEGKALLDQVGGFLRRGMVDMTKATARSDIPTWLEHTQHRTDAVIGHVLHSTADGIPIQALEDVQNNKSTGRTFATNAPGVLPVLNALPPIFNEPKQAIHLRMTPSPWTSFGLGGAAAFPQIEMRIVFDAETQMPSLRMLNAVTDERVSDLMLPQNMADLRFISRTSLGYAAAQADSNVTAYLANASLKVTGKGRLGAPPTLQMRIPSRILRKGSQVAKAFSEGGVSEDVEMEYLFAGLDFREYIQYDLADHIMTYTKIEGGITGGRRSELLLHKTPSKEISDNTNDDSTGFDQDFAQLFQLAYKVVSVLDNREFGRSPNSIRRALLSPMRPASTDKGAQNGV